MKQENSSICSIHCLRYSIHLSYKQFPSAPNLSQSASRPSVCFASVKASNFEEHILTFNKNVVDGNLRSWHFNSSVVFLFTFLNVWLENTHNGLYVPLIYFTYLIFKKNFWSSLVVWPETETMISKLEMWIILLILGHIDSHHVLLWERFFFYLVSTKSQCSFSRSVYTV